MSGKGGNGPPAGARGRGRGAARGLHLRRVRDGVLLRAAALALSHSRCASSARTAALASPGGFMKPAGPLPHRVVEPSLERLHPLLDALVHEQVPQRCFALARRAPRGRTSDRPRPCRRTRSGQPPGAGIHRPAASILDPTRAFAFTLSLATTRTTDPSTPRYTNYRKVGRVRYITPWWLLPTQRHTPQSKPSWLGLPTPWLWEAVTHMRTVLSAAVLRLPHSGYP